MPSKLKASRGQCGEANHQKGNKSNTIIPRSKPNQELFLPVLDADLQIQFYAAKQADTEMARSEFAECFRILSDASEQFDAMQARKLKSSLSEAARFLGLKEVQE